MFHYFSLSFNVGPNHFSFAFNSVPKMFLFAVPCVYDCRSIQILKTENTLRNMVNPDMRKRRQRGLLKGEEMHQLARDINYGNRGKITARDLEAQRNCCNCLTFIMACVIYWQANEISRILRECHLPEGLKLSLLEHISPIGWNNIVLYGEYIINKELIKTKTCFRESM